MKKTPLALLLFAGSCTALAQSPLENANTVINEPEPRSVFDEAEDSLKEVPPLFDSETSDLGPQYLLLPGKAQHNWFQAIVDMRWMRSSNPTLDDASNREASDLFITTAQFSVTSPDKKLWGGQSHATAGVRYQIFRYGILDDTDINGLPVDRNDFDGTTLFSNLTWKKSNWQAQVGLRWTRLDNDLQGSGFFEEIVPNWALSRDFFTSPSTRIRLSYDGAYFFTDSKTFLPPFDDLNDRLANSLSASLLHQINPKLYIEPSIRITYAIYDESISGDREDITLNLGTSLSYYFTRNTQLRLFTRYQKRDSNEDGIIDYENWDLGLGASLAIRF